MADDPSGLTIPEVIQHEISGCLYCDYFVQWYEDSFALANPVWTFYNDMTGNTIGNYLLSNVNTQVQLDWNGAVRMAGQTVKVIWGLIRTDKQDDYTTFQKNYDEYMLDAQALAQGVHSGSNIFMGEAILPTSPGAGLWRCHVTLDHELLLPEATYRIYAIIYDFDGADLLSQVTFISDEIEIEDVQGVFDTDSGFAYSGSLTDYTRENTTNNLAELEAGERIQAKLRIDYAGTLLEDTLLALTELPLYDIRQLIKYAKVEIISYIDRAEENYIIYDRQWLYYDLILEEISTSGELYTETDTVYANDIEFYYTFRLRHEDWLRPMAAVIDGITISQIDSYTLNTRGREVYAVWTLFFEYFDNKYLKNETITVKQKMTVNNLNTGLNINSLDWKEGYGVCEDFVRTINVNHTKTLKNRLLMSILSYNNKTTKEHEISNGELEKLTDSTLKVIQEFHDAGANVEATAEHSFECELLQNAKIIMISKEIP